MSEKNFNEFKWHCPQTMANPERLKELMQSTFNKYGGENNLSPFLFKMSNHDIRKEFVTGGIVSENLSVFVDYVPVNRRLKVKILSKNKISNDDYLLYIKERFPGCVIDT